jgi:thioredoxin-related protein
MTVNNPTPNNPTPKKSSLDTLANIAIIVVCAIAAVVLSFQVRDRLFPQRAPGAPPQAEKGEQYAQLKAVVPAGSSRALVVAVQPGCHFCNDSLPFYKNLIDQRNQKDSKVKIVAAVPTTPKPEDGQKLADEESQKFATAGAKPDSMVNLDFAAVKVPGTPTLMLVDNNGKVLNVWVGKLDSDGEKEVLKAL